LFLSLCSTLCTPKTVVDWLFIASPSQHARLDLFRPYRVCPLEHYGAKLCYYYWLVL
jgi:hypothetical protein